MKRAIVLAIYLIFLIILVVAPMLLIAYTILSKVMGWK